MTSPPTRAFAPLIDKGFEVLSLSHGSAILEVDFPHAMGELQAALDKLDLPITEIIGSGGGVTKFTQRLRNALYGMDWQKHIFVITKKVDGVEKDSTSHEIDHVRRSEHGVLALEIEWNNKDPFFDRDLENFKRLHAEGAISVGLLITRGTSLQESMKDFVRKFVDQQGITSFEELAEHGYVPTAKQKARVLKRTTRPKNPLTFAEAWSSDFVGDKYSKSTTYWNKLMDRVHRGVGNPCPLVFIGLPASIVKIDSAKIELLAEPEEEITPE